MCGMRITDQSLPPLLQAINQENCKLTFLQYVIEVLRSETDHRHSLGTNLLTNSSMYHLYETLKHPDCKLDGMGYVFVTARKDSHITSGSLHHNKFTFASMPFLIEALWSKTCSLRNL
jgi:hypothetical protein